MTKQFISIAWTHQCPQFLNKAGSVRIVSVVYHVGSILAISVKRIKVFGIKILIAFARIVIINVNKVISIIVKFQAISVSFVWKPIPKTQMITSFNVINANSGFMLNVMALAQTSWRKWTIMMKFTNVLPAELQRKRSDSFIQLRSLI